MKIRKVTGKSMEPTLKEGDYVIITKSNLKKNDLVVVNHAGKEKIKRITRIDGENYYLEGDNKILSSDFWTGRDSILGKVIKKIK